MNKKVINTEKPPAAIGPYSQGIDLGNLVFTSGQLPIDMKTGELANDIKNATNASLENVSAILEKAGTSMDKVIKTTVFLKNMEDFRAMNEVYGEFFKSEQPARSCYEVAKLPKDALVEIEVVAVK